MHRQELAVLAFDIAPPARKFLLLLIASHADESGRGARPAVSTTIATMVGLDKRQAKRHVASLRAEGYLLETGRYPVPGGREIVEYAVAMDEETRQEWATGVTHDTHPSGVTHDTRPNYNFKRPEVLRTSVRAGGANDQESPMPGAGFEREDDGQSRLQRPQMDSGDDLLPIGYVETPKPVPGAQKGAQRRGGVQGELAAHFVARQMEVNPNKRSNISQCAQMIAKKLKLTGVDPTIVERMIDAYWDDPRVRANHRPTQFPHLHFLNVVWEDLLLRVQRSSTTETYGATPAEIAKRNRRIGL